MTLIENIIEQMKAKDIPYEIFNHVPVYTNPTMAEALNVSESETVKSLVLKTKEKETIVLVMPGDKKVNWKQAAAGMNTKKVSFAKPHEVQEMVGCEVGCVPPFGHLSALPVYMDPDMLNSEYVYFNPGVHNQSIKLASRDLQKLCAPQML